ncbi:MAG TPA: KH domain-containing protein [Chondromyces sp.]|nr:KH domain-containing protein [Chondromyces sp.]
MNELILAIVKPLVDYPEHVSVDAQEEANRTVYRLTVHQEDVGKVIGKHGRVAKAIRTIIYAAASSVHSKKVYLEIVD